MMLWMFERAGKKIAMLPINSFCSSMINQ